MVKDLPEGNLLLSASILFSGASFAKVSRVFSAMNISSISQTTFYDHNKKLLQPTIISLWNDTQNQLLDWLSQRPGEIVLGGDMRADSPGHSAKYGSYTVMELRSNRVLHISLVQVRRLTCWLFHFVFIIYKTIYVIVLLASFMCSVYTGKTFYIFYHTYA